MASLNFQPIELSEPRGGGNTGSTPSFRGSDNAAQGIASGVSSIKHANAKAAEQGAQDKASFLADQITSAVDQGRNSEQVFATAAQVSALNELPPAEQAELKRQMALYDARIAQGQRAEAAQLAQTYGRLKLKASYGGRFSQAIDQASTPFGDMKVENDSKAKEAAAARFAQLRKDITPLLAAFDGKSRASLDLLGDEEFKVVMLGSNAQKALDQLSTYQSKHSINQGRTDLKEDQKRESAIDFALQAFPLEYAATAMKARELVTAFPDRGQRQVAAQQAMLQQQQDIVRRLGPGALQDSSVREGLSMLNKMWMEAATIDPNAATAKEWENKNAIITGYAGWRFLNADADTTTTLGALGEIKRVVGDNSFSQFVNSNVLFGEKALYPAVNAAIQSIRTGVPVTTGVDPLPSDPAKAAKQASEISKAVEGFMAVPENLTGSTEADARVVTGMIRSVANSNNSNPESFSKAVRVIGSEKWPEVTKKLPEGFSLTSEEKARFGRYANAVQKAALENLLATGVKFEAKGVDGHVVIVPAPGQKLPKNWTDLTAKLDNTFHDYVGFLANTSPAADKKGARNLIAAAKAESLNKREQADTLPDKAWNGSIQASASEEKPSKE